MRSKNIIVPHPFLYLKNLVNNLLEKVDFRVDKLSYFKATEFKGQVIDSPLILDYCRSREGVIVRLPLNKGRGLPLFSFGTSDFHPYIVAASSAIQKNSRFSFEIIYKKLHEYYSSAPKNVNMMFDLDLRNSVYGNSKPWTIVMPWEYRSHESWSASIIKSVLEENKKYKPKLDISNGWAWTGVTSDEKCYVESMRIYELLKSISDKGYVRKNSLDGDIRAHLLYDTDSQWCWQAVGGQHRACAQASFKCKSVMVKIQMMIRRSESKHWPNVVNGLYTEDEALDIFDKILNCYIPQFVNTI